MRISIYSVQGGIFMLIIDKDKNFILKPNTDKPSDPKLTTVYPSDISLIELLKNFITNRRRKKL